MTERLPAMPQFGSQSSRSVGWGDISAKIAMIVVFGFSLFGKPFAYVAMPLGLIMFLDRRPTLKPMYGSLTKSRLLSSFSWAVLFSIMYGIVQVLYGLFSDYSPFVALQIFSFNLFPLYLLLGIWGGCQYPAFIRKYIRFFAWFGVICTPFNLIMVKRMIDAGDEHTLTFGMGFGILLGIFAFEKNLLRYWIPIVVFSFWLVANQIRADWLGFCVALLIWGAATKNLGRVFAMAGAITALLAIGFVADFSLPGLPGRGGDISSRETVGRALSSVNPELAAEYSPNARVYAGTVGWRTSWWRSIREAVSESPRKTIFGLGYGFPLKTLGPPDIQNSDIRSPHNIFYFVLSYSGAAGVCLFFWLQISILLLLWKAYKNTGQVFGLAFYVYTLVGAFFGNFLETPQGAIPTYLIAGFCLAPLFREKPLPEKGPVRRQTVWNSVRTFRYTGRELTPS